MFLKFNCQHSFDLIDVDDYKENIYFGMHQMEVDFNATFEMHVIMTL